MEPLAEYVDGLPNLCLQEPLISLGDRLGTL